MAANLLLTNQINQQRLNDASKMIYGQPNNDLTQYDDVTLSLAAAGEEGGFFPALGASFLQSGVITGVGELAHDTVARFGIEPDPEFDFLLHMNAREDVKKRVEQVLADPEMGMRTVHNLAHAKSADEIAYHLEKYENAKIDLLKAQSNGWGNAAGFAASIGLDIAAVVALAAVSRGALNPALGSLLNRVASPLQATHGATRLAGAARLGTLGGIEGTAEAALQYATDPTMSEQDIAFGAAIGTVLGSLLGGVFPRLSGASLQVDPASKADYIALNIVERADAADVPVSAGAAATADDLGPRAFSSATPGKGAGTMWFSKVINPLIGLNSSAQKVLLGALRSPKRWIEDVGVEGAKEFRQAAEARRVGKKQLHEAVERLLKLTAARESELDNVGVQTARKPSAQVILARYQQAAVDTSRKVDHEYLKITNELYDTNKLQQLVAKGSRSTLFNRFVRGFDQHAYEEMAESWRQAQFIAQQHNVSPDIYLDRVIPKEIRDELDSDQLNKLVASLDKTGRANDKFYKDMSRLEVDLGIIGEDELIDGYSPQILNTRAVAEFRTEYKSLLLDAFALSPDEEWLRRHFMQELDQEGNVIAEGLAEIEGQGTETFEQLSRRNPEFAEHIIDEWSDVALAARRRMVDAVEDELREEVRRFSEEHISPNAEKAQAKIDRVTANVEKIRAKIKEVKDRPANKSGGFQAHAELEQLANKLTRAEHNLDNLTRRFKRLRAVQQMDELDAVSEFKKRNVGNNASRRAAKQFDKKFKKLDKAQKALEARTLDEMIDEIIRKQLSNESPTGLIPTEARRTSSRFKHRTIDFKEYRLDPRYRKFYLTDHAALRDGYARGTGAQIAFRQAYNIVDTADARLDLQKWKDDALAGYDQDIAKFAGDQKKVNKIRAEKRIADFYLDHILRDFLGQADMGGGLLRETTDAILAGTAAATLGKVILSQLPDLAVAAFAGGSLSAGMGGLTRRARPIIKELEKQGRFEMVTSLEGIMNYQARRMKSLTDMDRIDIDIGGGKMRKVAHTMSDVATVEGWANFMNQWNYHVRTAWTISFADKIHKDITQKGWDALSAGEKVFYKRQGINDQDFLALADEYKAASSDIDGKVTLPDESKWDPRRLQQWHDLLRGAGDEALLDPSIGDRPFLNSYPLGRLFTQFQSFVFTAGDRFIAPLMQNVATNPTDMRSYAAVLIALGLAEMNSTARAYLRGDEFGDDRVDAWSTAEGAAQNFQEVFIRSPMASGGFSLAYEALTQNFGNAANDALFGGRTFLREAPTRFQQEQGLAGILGPGFGLANTVLSAARSAAEGDVDRTASMIGNRLPIVNTVIPQLMIMKAIDEASK